MTYGQLFALNLYSGNVSVIKACILPQKTFNEIAKISLMGFFSKENQFTQLISE